MITYPDLLAALIDNEFEVRPIFPRLQPSIYSADFRHPNILRIIGHGKLFDCDYNLVQQHPEVTAVEIETATGIPLYRFRPGPGPELRYMFLSAPKTHDVKAITE